MKVSRNWLQEHVDLAALDAQRLAELLTFAGVEVEGIEESGLDSDKVVVAQILSSDPHPNADRLTVCRVTDGESEMQIVCGAKNYKVGDKVPLAVPGAVLPGGFKIKKGKLRGELSEGMMCSGKELGMSEDSEGLWILGADAPLGAPMKDIIEPDVVFDLEVTPNRPDLLCHLGMAREISALTGEALKGKPGADGAGVATRPANPDEVRIDAPAACPLYTARTIEGVTVGESPEWLQKKLASIGLRPINNVVDITNFVLFETGHPLHAFDADKLEGGIVVRAAVEGEKFLALDGEEYALEANDLVIADSVKAIALAGVMGGENTGVSEATVNVLLESAYFTPSGIRRTSRRLGLMSDSSYRFERGTDPAQVVGSSDRVTRLILELAGGSAGEETLIGGEVPAPPEPVALRPGKCRQVLGADISGGEIDRILTSLGLVKTGGETWRPPTYRLDLTREIDLVEEVTRVYGLDPVPARRAAAAADLSAEDIRHDFKQNLRRDLVAKGFNEAISLTLVSEDDLGDDFFGADGDETLGVRNPLTDDHAILRPGLVAGLLKVAEHNARMGAGGLRFFEIGKVFHGAGADGREEVEKVAILMHGQVIPPSWHHPKPRGANYFDLRGVVEAVCGGAEVEIRPRRTDRLVLAGDIFVDGRETPAGAIGQLWPARVRELDMTGDVVVAELEIEALLELRNRAIQFEPLDRYPAITRDVAMETGRSMSSAEMAGFFRGLDEPLLRGAELFDVFTDDTGRRLGTDKKSLAYSLTYRDRNRTLTSSEVDEAHARILEKLQKELGVKLR